MPFRNFRTMIVDDNLAFLDSLAEMLRQLGVRDVVRADCGENAVRALREIKEPADIILCNFGMPRGNGLQVLREIRLGQFRRQRPDSCFILISSSSARQIIQTAKQLDVSGYLITPLTVDALKEEILKARRRVPRINIARYISTVVPEYIIGGNPHEQPLTDATTA